MEQIDKRVAYACALAFALSVNLRVQNKEKKYKEYGLMVGRDKYGVTWRQPWDELLLGNSEVFLPVGPNMERIIDLVDYAEEFDRSSAYSIREAFAHGYIMTSYIELSYDGEYVDRLSLCNLNGLFSVPWGEWVILKLRDATIYIPYYNEAERRKLFANNRSFCHQHDYDLES